MLDYNFGPNHPLTPERLRRTIPVCEALGFECVDPGSATRQEAEAVHDKEYVEAVQRISEGERIDGYLGFGGTDTPPFPGIYEASLAYSGGSVQAAKDVRDGSTLGLTLAGGLHHARRKEASGFCVFNDPAMAIAILLERFERVAYVDIDLHHGDGVQWIFYDDPRVLTCSIHETGRTLYPGTGFVSETGNSFTAWNVPLSPNTTGDVWLSAFRGGIMPALRAFSPQAIVLQMGADPHFLDPLGHLRCMAQDWLEAIRDVRDLHLPLVAKGGGGYNLTSAPRMWVAAALCLTNQEVPERVPVGFERWGMETFFDMANPYPCSGQGDADVVLYALAKNLESAILEWDSGPYPR